MTLELDYRSNLKLNSYVFEYLFTTPETCVKNGSDVGKYLGT